MWTSTDIWTVMSEWASRFLTAHTRPLKSPSTHYRSFWRRVFPVNHLHWYGQPNKNNQATEHTNNIKITQPKKESLVNSTTHNHKKPRISNRTDIAWFSRLVRHPARKRSGSILTTRGALHRTSNNRAIRLSRILCAPDLCYAAEQQARTQQPIGVFSPVTSIDTQLPCYKAKKFGYRWQNARRV